MLITQFQPSINNISQNLIINNISQFFHTWIKKNCFQVDEKNYELDINNLKYLSILLYEIKNFNSNNNFNNMKQFNLYIKSKYNLELENSKTLIQDLCIKDKFERVYFAVEESLLILNSENISLNLSIQKIKILINKLKLYAKKVESNILYYNFYYE